jgi:uncharacterized protein
MFHTIITLAFILPNIYVFLRIYKLFINKGYRLTYTLVYVLLALVYPLSNLIPSTASFFLKDFLTTFGSYILPFYLYLFLLILCFDIFLLINLPLRIISKARLKQTGFKAGTLTAIVVLSLIIVIAGIINFNTIRTSEYKIEVPARSATVSHLKIAFVADYHINRSTDVGFVKRFVKKIDEINPDMMIFGGDIVEGDREDKKLETFEKLLSEIKVRYGVFAVLGNHEHYAGGEIGRFFGKAGITVLCDTNIVIAKSFNLAGRNDSHIRTRKPIEELLKSIPDSLPLILVDHRPTEIDRVSKTKVDVQLSGHTHNGQLFPINLITRQIYELSWGYRKIGNTNFFVTSGIRLWGPPVRTTGKSEIMVIDIDFR